MYIIHIFIYMSSQLGKLVYSAFLVEFSNNKLADNSFSN